MSQGVAFLDSYKVFDGTVNDVTGTYLTDVTNVRKLNNIAYQYSWSNGAGSPEAELFVEVSASNGEIWTPLTFSPGTPSLSGNSGNDVIQIQMSSATQMRIRIVVSQGSCDLKIYIAGKGI